MARVTRIAVSSAGRTSGTAAAYDAQLPAAVRGVTEVALVGATVAYPPALQAQGAYVILRIEGMEVVASNDTALDRCFVALPTTGSLQKLLPAAYRPAAPIRRLARMRVSFVRADGVPVDFLGADHVLQFDVTHEAPAPAAPLVEAPVLLGAGHDAPSGGGPEPGVPADLLGAELTELLAEGVRPPGDPAAL